MWSANSTAKLLFLILILVEGSSARYVHTHNWFQNGHVAIRWDIMNKTRGGYSANVTIINCMKDHDIERPWALRWTWTEDEILLSTVGVTAGTKHGNDSVGALKRVIAVDLARQGGVIPSWFREADLAKSSCSFQITVGRAGIGYYWPPQFINLITTPRSRYLCHSLMEGTQTRGYLNTWRTECGLYNAKIKVPHEDL